VSAGSQIWSYVLSIFIQDPLSYLITLGYRVHTTAQNAVKQKKNVFFVISGSGTDPISLLILLLLLLLFFLWEWSLQKSLRLHRFRLGRDEIWQDCSSSKYASIDEVRFLIMW